MPVLDPSSNVGKVRLRIGDWQDLVILPDAVIEQALVDKDDNLPQAAQLCAQYILAILSHKTHRKLTGQLEVWGAEQFDNYLKFLKATVLNPNLMDIAPVPYDNSTCNPLIEFVEAWNASYNPTTSTPTFG